ncbi:MAG: ABC transporter substrate-binding protein [Oligoflexia bacterium]|nr:ABC transporter substrate-binding protein [Oligoflexia bacterium]
MSKFITLSSAFLLVVFQFAAPLALAESARIGVIAPLTGDAAGWGETFKSAYKLHQDDAAARGLSSIQVLWEDDQATPTNTIAAFRKLAAQDVLLVVTLSAAPSNAVAPLAEQLKIPLVAVSVDPQASRGRKWVVNFWLTPEAGAHALAGEVRRKGYHRVARVSTMHEGILAVNHAFDKEIGAELEMLLDQEFAPDVRDFRTVVARIKALRGLDALGIFMMPGQSGLCAKQLRAAGVTAPFFTNAAASTKGETTAAQGALAGVSYYDSTVDPSFLLRFQQKFPGVSSFGAAIAYDLFNMISMTPGSQPLTRDEMNLYLHNIKDYSGASGTFSATSDGTFTLPATIKTLP